MVVVIRIRGKLGKVVVIIRGKLGKVVVILGQIRDSRGKCVGKLGKVVVDS